MYHGGASAASIQARQRLALGYLHFELGLSDRMHKQEIISLHFEAVERVVVEAWYEEREARVWIWWGSQLAGVRSSLVEHVIG